MLTIQLEHIKYKEHITYVTRCNRPRIQVDPTVILDVEFEIYLRTKPRM